MPSQLSRADGRQIDNAPVSDFNKSTAALLQGAAWRYIGSPLGTSQTSSRPPRTRPCAFTLSEPAAWPATKGVERPDSLLKGKPARLRHHDVATLRTSAAPRRHAGRKFKVMNF